ncbi:MAG: hypothetical protein V3R95_09365 [Dehalococcoidia bacterium]
MLLLAGIAALGAPRAALACSGNVNPFETLDVIVAGRITDIARAPELDRLSPTGVYQAGAFVGIRVTFEVDRYLKGFGPATLITFDAASAYYGNGPGEQFSETDLDGLRYAGSSGACGALDEDPRGQYRVAGLFRQPDGSLSMHIFGRFAITDSASDPAIVRAIERAEEELTALGLPFPPAAGSAGLASDGQRNLAGASVVLLLIVALGLAAGARRVVARDSR